MAKKELGPLKKLPTSPVAPILKSGLDALTPRTPSDVALMLIPYGKIARTVGGITGKGASAVTKLYRNMGK